MYYYIIIGLPLIKHDKTSMTPS